MNSRKLSRNVVVLGWVSFFTDVASEMLYPVMPLFLIGSLGASTALLGTIDGIAEGISSGLRWIGGALSDRLRKRKVFVALGYGLSAISKPIIGLSQLLLGWPLFLAGRCTDRLGKSIRTASRDALIADSTDEEHRGAAFGFHRAMDSAGATLGPLLTLALLWSWVGRDVVFGSHLQAMTQRGADVVAKFPLQTLFYFAIIPGLLSVALVIMGVKEIAPTKAGSGKAPKMLQAYPRPFWMLVVANAVFSFGNSSDSFLILRSGEMGLSFGSILLVYAMYNAIFASASMPFGDLSDRIGRRRVLAAGWFIYVIVYVGFACWNSSIGPWPLLAVYGLYQALTDGVSKAWITDLVPSNQRAGAIGLFMTVNGIGQLAGSAMAGALWHVRPAHGAVVLPLLINAACVVAAIPLLGLVAVKKQDQPDAGSR